MNRSHLAAALFALAPAMLLSAHAFAQQGGSPPPDCTAIAANNILDCVLTTFEARTKTWEARLAELALRLFWILALIEFTWAALLLAFRGADLSEWMSSLLNQVLFIGFFGALLQFSASWAGDIVDSFRQAANIAGGASVIRPSDIFDVGVRLATGLWGAATWSLSYSLVLAISSIFLAIAFGLIAASLIVAVVESYIVISAGVLLMGFGGSRWTKDYAVRTFQYCISVGAKLFVLQLIAGLMVDIVEPWAAAGSAASPSGSLTSVFGLLGIAIIFVSIARVIPEMVQGLINGTSLAPGAGLYGTTVGLTTGAIAAAAGGAMAGVSAGRLAQEQLRTAAAAGSAPGSWAGWTASFAGRTMANMGIYAASNIGDRLSGRAAHGSRLGQQSAAMDRDRSVMAAERGKGEQAASANPPPPSPPKNVNPAGPQPVPQPPPPGRHTP